MIPTDTLYLTIDKEAVKQSGMMMAADSIPDKWLSHWQENTRSIRATS